mmetsp:Transcript_29340/g.73635  ORF Transcript_29340/g.73635 Transcript_29340/m.73635 type:complete len:276 (-) Transcript_29340:128-955(-)
MAHPNQEQQVLYVGRSGGAELPLCMELHPYDRLDSLKASGKALKVLHVVRHAQGTHNVKKDYRAAEQLDAVLTPFGLEQCGALAKLTAGLAGVELLVTSPLRRCVQTALHGFQPHIDRGVPLIALESVRETVNFTCDRRISISELSGEFPSLDFSYCEEDVDPIWAAYAEKFGSQDDWRSHRESDDPKHIAARARDFLQWVAERDEGELLVSSHSAFLHHVFNHAHDGYTDGQPFAHLADSLTPIFSYADADFESLMRGPWENCELRSMILVSEA